MLFIKSWVGRQRNKTRNIHMKYSTYIDQRIPINLWSIMDRIYVCWNSVIVKKMVLS